MIEFSYDLERTYFGWLPTFFADGERIQVGMFAPQYIGKENAKEYSETVVCKLMASQELRATGEAEAADLLYVPWAFMEDGPPATDIQALA